MKFTTYDSDIDQHTTSNCAVSFIGAWWYNACHYSNLNGQYGTNDDRGIIWNFWRGSYRSMVKTKMMMRKKIKHLYWYNYVTRTMLHSETQCDNLMIADEFYKVPPHSVWIYCYHFMIINTEKIKVSSSKIYGPGACLNVFWGINTTCWNTCTVVNLIVVQLWRRLKINDLYKLPCNCNFLL